MSVRSFAQAPSGLPQVDVSDILTSSAKLAMPSARVRQTAQFKAASSRFHSSSLTALRARKLMPTVPNCAALDDWGAPLKTSARHVIWNPTNPAATTVA